MRKLSIIILSSVTLSLTNSFADATFKGLDADGNKEISSSELQRSDDKDINKYFNRLDKSGNGGISKDEYIGLKCEKDKTAAKAKAKADKEEEIAAPSFKTKTATSDESRFLVD